MNKLLTVYDNNDPINNVISALTLSADEVFFIYHHEPDKVAFNNIDKVLKRHRNIKTNFIRLNNDEEDIREIIRKNKNITVDVGGAKYLSLLLFEICKDLDNMIVYFDDEENVVKDYRTHKAKSENIYKLTIEDIFELHNGRVIENMHASAKDKKTIDIINKIVENNLDNYSSFIRYVTKVNAIVNSARNSKGRSIELNEKQIRDIKTDSCYRKTQDLFEIKDRKITFTTPKLRQLIGVSGAFLENYLYHKLIKSKKFDEVSMSTVIDFSSGKDKYPVRCEIDILALKDNRLLFVSCKSNKIDTTDLNEIYVHNSLFGNVLSTPVICLCEEADEKFPSVYSKAEQMNIAIVDKSSISDGTFPEVFNKIVNGIYAYDKLPA